MTGPTEMNMDRDGVDALLTRWATTDRDPAIEPGAAMAAADRAMATARIEAMAQPANDRRWMPPALFGGGIAAAIAGVMFVSSGGGPVGAPAPAGSVPQAATAEIAATEAPPAAFTAPAPVAEIAPVELASTDPAEVPEPARPAPEAPPVALASADDPAPGDAPFGAPRRLAAGAQLATAGMEEFDFTEANDDLFMAGYVFTPRPEEEDLP